MRVKISIITVCLNAAKTLEKCIRSVAEQTYPNIEYIIIDGNSTDETKTIVEEYGNAVTSFVSENDGGIYPAMNKGIRLATGDFVLLLGADDYVASENAISDVVAAMDQNNLASVYYGLMEVRYPDGSTHIYDAGQPAALGETMILGCLPSQATFISKNAIESVGFFDEQYKLAADYDWYLRALNNKQVSFGKVEVLCSSFFMGGASSNLAQCRAETDAIQNNADFYKDARWDEIRLKKWQTDSLDWRVRHDLLQEQFKEKKAAAKELNNTYEALVSERAIFVGELAKLREGVDALEAERQKLQTYLNEANSENSKLVERLNVPAATARPENKKSFFRGRGR